MLVQLIEVIHNMRWNIEELLPKPFVQELIGGGGGHTQDHTQRDVKPNPSF